MSFHVIFCFPLRMWVKGTCWTWLCDRLLSFEFLFVDPPWGSTSGGQLFTYNPTDLVNIKCLERLKEGEGDDREMVGWHHRFDGVEFGQTPRVGDRRGSLVCPSLWGRKEADTTEDWTELNTAFRLVVIKNDHRVAALLLLQTSLVHFRALLVLFPSRVDFRYCHGYRGLVQWYTDVCQFFFGFVFPR